MVPYKRQTYKLLDMEQKAKWLLAMHHPILGLGCPF